MGALDQGEAPLADVLGAWPAEFLSPLDDPGS